MVCSFFEPEINIDSRIKVLHANGSIIKYLLELRKVLMNNKFDIIHAHSVHVAFMFILICLTLKYF